MFAVVRSEKSCGLSAHAFERKRRPKSKFGSTYVLQRLVPDRARVAVVREMHRLKYE